MQGDPLYIVAYGLGVLLLIKNLKVAHPDVTQTRYDDDAGALGMFGNIEDYLNYLTQVGLERKYYPDPSKSILIIHPDNFKAGILFVTRNSFKVCKGARYLGGFIGDDSKREWLII